MLHDMAAAHHAHSDDTPGPDEASSGTRAPGRTWDKLPELAAAGLLPSDALGPLAEVVEHLPLGIPPVFQPLLSAGRDPISIQVIPDVRELSIADEERSDPIGDAAHTQDIGLIQRYPDRVLLQPTRICAVYCRFCFRRDVVGDPAFATLPAAALDRALEHIRSMPRIWEVILTGGDPLILSPARLGALLQALWDIPHVQVIRIHTRVPLVAPERVGPALLEALRGPKALWIVLHANHASEFTPQGSSACARLIDAGFPMLSQSVLLRGVNDSTDALETLMRTLVAHRIKPYYLHHLDLVPGTRHLRVPLSEGRALIRSLRGRVSGLCQPQYVLDIPGGFGKVPADDAWITGPDPSGVFQVTDPWGEVHRYKEPTSE